MIYAMSDLHGCPLEQVQAVLKKANFTDSDFLFIIGDVIDRGTHSIELLQWMIKQPNIELMLGNHEEMLLMFEYLFDGTPKEEAEQYRTEHERMYSVWKSNGGAVTIQALRELPLAERKEILEYLHVAPLYEVIDAGDNIFLLTHSGLDNFNRNKKLTDYDKDDFLWARPMLSDVYYERVISIFGHTPTAAYGSEYRGKILKTKTWIDIDAGAGSGFPPALLRLDDLEEFYL